MVESEPLRVGSISGLLYADAVFCSIMTMHELGICFL